MSSLEIYVPVLLKFTDDRVVFTGAELQSLNNIVLKNLVINNKHKKNMRECFPNKFKETECQHLEEEIVKIIPDFDGSVKIELFYYHHRIIIKYNIFYKENFSTRKLRSVIIDHSTPFLCNFVGEINSLVYAGKVKNDGMIIMYYSYYLTIVYDNNIKYGSLPERVETMTLRVFESSKRFFSYGKPHYVRISIPGIEVYCASPMGIELKCDFINTIYHHILYNKKLRDNENGEYNNVKKFDNSNLFRLNRMDEVELSQFWQHAIDFLGGDANNNQNVKNGKKMYYYTILASLFAIASIIIAILQML